MWIPSVCKRAWVSYVTDAHTHVHAHAHTHTCSCCVECMKNEHSQERWQTRESLAPRWQRLATFHSSKFPSRSRARRRFHRSLKIRSMWGEMMPGSRGSSAEQLLSCVNSCSTLDQAESSWRENPRQHRHRVRFSSFFSLFCKLLPKTEGHPKKSTRKATQQEILRLLEACLTTNSQLETPKKNIQIPKYVLQRGLIIDVSKTEGSVGFSNRHTGFPLVTLKLKREVDETGATASSKKVLQKEKAPWEVEVWAGWVQTPVAHPGSQRSRPSETKHQWSTTCTQMLKVSCERNHEVWHCSSVIWQRVGCLCLTDEGWIQATHLKPLDIKDTSGLVRATFAAIETEYF